MQSTGALNYTERSAVGVVVLVSPWNLPLYLLTFKMAPALVCGNAVVCKPSEMTSVTAWMLCDLFRQAGACCHGNGTFRYQVPPFARIVTATPTFWWPCGAIGRLYVRVFVCPDNNFRRK